MIPTKKFLPKYLWSLNIVIIYGIVIGTSFPNITSLAYPLLYYLVIFNFFIAILETSNEKIGTEDNISIQYKIITHLTKLIIIPVSLFYLLSYGTKVSSLLSYSIVLGMALKFSSAPTFALPEITGLLNGNKERSLLFTLENNIISIITIPAILCLLTKRSFEISYILPITIYIIKIVIPPLALGKIAVKFYPQIINQCKPYFPTTSKITIFIIMIAACNGLNSEAFQNPLQTVLISTLCCIIYIILAVSSWFLEPSDKKADKLFFSLFMATPSTTPILFAHL